MHHICIIKAQEANVSYRTNNSQGTITEEVNHAFLRNRNTHQYLKQIINIKNHDSPSSKVTITVDIETPVKSFKL